MSRAPALLLAALMALALLGGCSSSPGETSSPTAGARADLIVRNARVFTSSDQMPWAQAVAVKAGIIVRVGDDVQVESLIGPNTQVIDAQGRMLVPGFVDNHCHLLWMGALQAIMANLYDASSVGDIKTVISQFAAQNPNNPFVMGIGFRLEYIPGGGLPTRQQADAILTNRPLILWGNGGHTGWLNTLALNQMRQKNPAAFERLSPVRDPGTGELTGAFLHFYAFNPMDFYSADELGQDLQQRMLLAMALAVQEASKMGVTTVHDIQIYRPFMPVLLAFKESGGLDNIRARCAYYVDSMALQDEAKLRADLQYWTGLQATSDAHLVLGESVKFYMDGHAGNHTSFLLQPYSDMAGYRGEPLWTQQTFDRVVEIVDSCGLQACTHATGDAAIRRVVDAYEKLPWHDARHRIEHVELVDPADIPRIAGFQVRLAMQPSHFFGIDPAGETSLGLDRVRRMMPWRSLRDGGCAVTAGSDWIAAPINPLYGLYFGNLRVNYKGDNTWNPQEALPLEDLLRDYTIESARGLFLEDMVGSIEAGKYADFVLYEVDLLDLSTWKVPLNGDVLGKLDDFVLLTVVDGRIVYQKQGVTF